VLAVDIFEAVAKDDVEALQKLFEPMTTQALNALRSLSINLSYEVTMYLELREALEKN
jgi:hypothetical protein